jgi:hypothetical protein
MSDEYEDKPDAPEFAPEKPDPNKPDRVDDMLASLETEEHTLGLEEHHFKLKNKEGQVEIWTIRELDGEGRGEYSDYQAKRTKFDFETGKPTGIKDTKGLEIKLVSLCLFDPRGIQADEKMVSKFPGKLIKKLAFIAARISGLDEKAEARAKKP